MVLKRATPEEKEAKRVDKAQRQSAEEQGRAEQAFWASPARQARAAFMRGDHVFQVVFDVMHTRHS